MTQGQPLLEKCISGRKKVIILLIVALYLPLHCVCISTVQLKKNRLNSKLRTSLSQMYIQLFYNCISQRYLLYCKSNACCCDKRPSVPSVLLHYIVSQLKSLVHTLMLSPLGNSSLCIYLKDFHSRLRVIKCIQTFCKDPTMCLVMKILIYHFLIKLKSMS